MHISADICCVTSAKTFSELERTLTTDLVRFALTKIPSVSASEAQHLRDRFDRLPLTPSAISHN